MIAALQKMLRPLSLRIANLVSRAVVRLVDDGKKVQLLQVDVLAEETRDDVERVQNYGFTSVPLDGAEAVVLFVGGRREHGLAVAVDDRRHRLTGLEPGEVAIYTDEGDSVIIRRGGTIEVTASTKVVLTAPVVELAGNSEPALKGAAYASAESTFLDALAMYAGAIKTVADPANVATPSLTAAITAFKTATAAAKSSKVKLS